MFVVNEEEKVEQDDERANNDENNDGQSSVKWFCHFPWISAQVTGGDWVATPRNISLNSNFTANIERTETRLTSAGE